MVEMVMMMIPMKSSVMAVTMASISPSRRDFPPADLCLPENFSLWCFPPRSGGGILLFYSP